jgi:hypothetical protein
MYSASGFLQYNGTLHFRRTSCGCIGNRFCGADVLLLLKLF